MEINLFIPYIWKGSDNQFGFFLLLSTLKEFVYNTDKY